jgi:pilus assembly protein CpaC
MKNIKTLILFLCLTLTASGIIQAQDSAEEIMLYVGLIKTIPVSSPTRIAVGSPDIADVTSAKEREITLLGKAPGTTTLVIWDSFGEQKYSVTVTAEDMTEAKRRIDSILETLNLPSVNAKTEEKEGKIFLMGSVKTPQDKERINVALAALKDKILDLIEVKEEEAVVEIDVQVLELNRDATRTLGLTWPGAINLIERGSPGIQPVGVKTSTLFKVLNLERATSAGAEPFTFKLDALIQEGKAQVLSRPRLACQSGKEAELLVGGEKPIFTTQVASATGGGDTTSVDYKEYGIKLKVKPTVVEGERIKLGLNVEVSEIGTADSIGTSSTTTAKAYPLTKRTVSTELYLNNGQSMAIGGLIKQKSAEDVRRVPGLSSIPLLGLLFRQKSSTLGGGTGERGNAELFIILTPRIISQGLADLKEVKKEAKPEPAYYTTTTDEDLSTPLGKYASVVKKRILDNLSYPSLAKEASFQGEVKLRLLLSYRGELLEAKIKGSSGYNILDENTLTVAKNSTPYPPFPESIKEKEIWVDIPIVYRLD